MRWRRKHLPKVVPRLELRTVLAVGVVPLFLARADSDVTALTEPLDEAETDLWLLAPSRVATFEADRGRCGGHGAESAARVPLVRTELQTCFTERKPYRQ